MEVVNEDYDEFVSLSTKLVDVDGAVARLQAPLLEVKGRVEAARTAVAAQAAALQEGLARRQAAAAARALLELAQDAVHVMAKVEKLLDELPRDSTPPPSPGQNNGSITQVAEAKQEELEARCRLLDRLCSEVSRLNFFTARGEELAVVRNMAPRIQRAASSLQSELNSALKAVLKAQNPTALAVLLHAYGSLGITEAAEVVVRQHVVAPVVAAAVQKVREQKVAQGGNTLSSQNSGSAARLGSLLSLAEVLPAVLAALHEETGPFFELALSPAGGAAAFDFLGGSVLPEVLNAIEAACPGCYSPGMPDAFHANYVASSMFIDALERLCVTLAQVERFRDSAAYSQHRKKWNLAAYYSLRFQDVAGALEEGLDGVGLSEADAAQEGDQTKLRFAATGAAWRALQSTVAPEVFLPQLADRFLKLALQVVARYCTWVSEGVEKNPSTIEGSGDGTAEGTEGMDVSGKERWAADASVEQLAAASQDITALQVAIQQELLLRFIELTDPQAADALGAAFGACDEQLGSASTLVLRAAAAGLVERCCEALKQLRGIVATFRMTSRGAPTRPAQYASAILAPLLTFLGAADGLSESGKIALVHTVLEGVVEQYRHLAHDTLSTVRKTESSLRRLKSRKGSVVEGSDGGGGALGTDELIAIQLSLDIEEFGKKVKECGVEPGDVQSFAELQAVVIPEQ